MRHVAEQPAESDPHPPIHPFLPSFLSGTAHLSHVRPERLPGILRGRRPLRRPRPGAAQEVAAARLRGGAGVLLRAGGVPPGGADHRGGGRVGRRPGPRRDAHRPVRRAAGARRRLRRRRRGGEPRAGAAAVPAAGGRRAARRPRRGGPVPRGAPGPAGGRALLEPGADGHARDQDPDVERVQHVAAGVAAAGLRHRGRLHAGPPPGAADAAAPLRSGPRAAGRRPAHLPVPRRQRLHLGLHEPVPVVRPHLPLSWVQLPRVRAGLLAGSAHRRDSGAPAALGTHPEDLFQEPPVFPEDAFPSPEGGQSREEENVKEAALFLNFVLFPF